MNQRKLRSRLALPARWLVRLAVPWMICLWVAATVSVVQADQTRTNQPAVNLGDLSLETLMQMEVPVVSSASKFLQKATAAPASVTVISAEEIQRYGYRTLADVLQSAPGFNIS